MWKGLPAGGLLSSPPPISVELQASHPHHVSKRGSSFASSIRTVALSYALGRGARPAWGANRHPSRPDTGGTLDGGGCAPPGKFGGFPGRLRQAFSQSRTEL